MIWRSFLFYILFILVGLSVIPEAEANRTKRQYGTSKQPYWQVGALDKMLSLACRRGEFGQRKIKLLTIGFVGRQGRAQTGIAKNGWNLADPKGLAQPRTTYHFFNQGYSNCKVYKATTPKTPKRR